MLPVWKHSIRTRYLALFISNFLLTLVPQVTLYFALLGKKNAGAYIIANSPVTAPLPPETETDEQMFVYWLRASSLLFIAIFAPPGI